MRLCTIAACLGLTLLPHCAQARPVSYPGGWMLMAQNDGDRNALELDYTFTPVFALGLRNEYDRADRYQIHSLALNNRLWRKNFPDAQANVFLMSGIGYAFENGGSDSSPAAYTGIEADWENRRFYTNYENKFTYAGTIDSEFSQSARIGVAPYIAEAGALHTWLMLQADHRPEGGQHFTLTPLVRLFKDAHLAEAGISTDGKILFNYTHQF